MTRHTKLKNWVHEMARMCKPEEIIWIDGSAEQKTRLETEAFSTGELIKLNQKRTRLIAILRFNANASGENWTISLGWFFPRKYRHVIGDILEDCAEMRQLDYTERRIKFHVVYQWLIAVITLVPTAVKTSITDILKQVVSPPK